MRHHDSYDTQLSTHFCSFSQLDCLLRVPAAAGGEGEVEQTPAACAECYFCAKLCKFDVRFGEPEQCAACALLVVCHVCAPQCVSVRACVCTPHAKH